MNEIRLRDYTILSTQLGLAHANMQTLRSPCSAHLHTCRSLAARKVETLPLGRSRSSTLPRLWQPRHIFTTMEERSDRGIWVLAAGSAAVASLATVHPPVWVPIIAISVTVLLFGVLAQWIKTLLQGSSKHDSGVDECSVTPSASQVLNLIKQRRSVYPKDFTGSDGVITQQHLELMLEAARWAPTHKLTQPWHFVVLSGAAKSAFEELTIKCCQELLPAEKAEQTVAKLKRKQSKDWPKVHCYIAICMKRHEEVPEWEEVAAVACGVQNLSLVATSLGVNGYWSSWQAVARDSPAMHHMLEIDGSRGDRCLGVWVVGQGDAERVAGYRPRRQDLMEKVVWKS